MINKKHVQYKHPLHRSKVARRKESQAREKALACIGLQKADWLVLVVTLKLLG